MTHFLQDILRQPKELARSLQLLETGCASSLRDAVAMLGSAQSVFLTGIGSSWHAAMSAASIFYEAGRPVYLIEASELLHFVTIPHDSVVVMLSRTGRSIEIVRLMEKARASGARVIGVTNGRDGALARESDSAILLEIAFDHAISVNTYSTLALATGVLAGCVTGRFDTGTKSALRRAIAAAEERIPQWREQIEASLWPSPSSPCYFLARGPSLGCAYEARLLWEEGVKRPATAIGTGGFRHGPQEIVTPSMRFGIWIDGRRMREEDLRVAEDLTRMGAHVALIGQHLTEATAELVLKLPEMASEWQWLIDPIPAQLLAERTARVAGVDADSFRLCSYIVETEGGLLNDAMSADSVQQRS